MPTPDPSRAYEVDGLIIGDQAGIFSSPDDPSYAAPSGSLHITPRGIWQNETGAANGWGGGSPLSNIQPRAVSGAGIEGLGDGELLFDPERGALVYRNGSVMLAFYSGALFGFQGRLNFSDPRNSHHAMRI